jgi:hypothetical protein
MLLGRILTSVLCAGALGCATPGTRPHDMSTAEHEQAAAREDEAAKQHATRYDPASSEEQIRCKSLGPTAGSPALASHGPCWKSRVNPTEEHERAAERHRQIAAEHRAASQALRAAEAQACVGIEPDDRDISPFDRCEDIVSVRPLTETSGGGFNPPSGLGPQKAPITRKVGAVVVFRAVPGMTAEGLQQLVDCHLARNAALGHVAPEMPECPLVPRGVEARVTSTGDGFAVSIRSDDPETAREILRRAERLIRPRPALSDRSAPRR